MVGGAVTAYFGALHLWWPKMTGRMYPEGWGVAAALLIFLGFTLTFFPQFVLGYLGMPRRYHTYDPQFQVLNVLSSAGTVVLAAAYLIPLFYFAWSLRYGRIAGPNPWHADGLEWTIPSPPPQHNFDRMPVITRDPYQYPWREGT
jgi:cytochrome c oxidase subunit 1